ncbi:MAG TPA: sialate O-acetylesterase, partial [Bacteroidota bacterium]|nr:sialate O-acetylesterase [Bacteroidota bacterium]
MAQRLFTMLMLGILLTTTRGYAQDPNFYIYLCFGQSNMEGNARIQEQDKTVDERFQVLESMDCPGLGRVKGHWYPAVPPLCRCSTGLSPADFFGRTMVATLPKHIRVGVVNVSVAGCKIELFDKDHFQAYADTAPSWMKGIIKQYDGNPYAALVAMGKRAQQDGVIKGILLHQGESNPNDSAWTQKVKSIYTNLISDLHLTSDSIPLLAGECVSADQQGACAAMNAIIATLPDVLPQAHVISSKGCAARPDHLHFTTEGYTLLGQRYG